MPQLDVAPRDGFLEAVSRYLVEYYRCDDCGHAWSHAKGDPNAPAREVTKAEGGELIRQL